MKLQHILIATDLSEETLAACRPIATLARASGVRLTLLHVVEELLALPHGAPLAPPVGAADTARRVEEARVVLEEQRQDYGPDLEIDTEVRAAPRVAEAICERAAALGVDLIALSTHGRTGWRHLALGSIAEAVLRRAAVPVLCFPRP